MYLPRSLPRDVIFDFDGTILNSAGNVLVELHAAITKNGLVVPKTFENVVIGPPMPQIIQGLFPGIEKSKLDAILSDFRFAHDSSALEKSFLYPDVIDLLLAFKERKTRLFIATNKPRAGLLNAMNKFGLLDLFQGHACFGDKGVATKVDSVRLLVEEYQINPLSGWMVGDAKTDITAGKACGLFTVAHMRGYSPREEILSSSPDLCIETYSELLETF